MSGAIYSDAWYKIAGSRVSLLPGVRVSRQVYRGRPWVVLEDGYSHRFFRVTPEAYDFIRSLHLETSVDEAWQACIRQNPDRAPSQEEVVQLLSQLHVSNLLFFGERGDSREIALRAGKTRKKELRAKLLSFLYFRVPIWDPDDFLTAVDRRLRRVPGWSFAMAWVLAMLVGAYVVITHVDSIADRSQGVFAWTNLPLLYACLAVMKMVHEICHGLVCKRYGGEVHALGLMFLVTTPLPYVDTTASWSFPNRWHRMLVSGAGMLADLFMAALGAVVWAATGPGLVNSLAFNVMMIGSISSLVFNGNPLLRFDAYYVLADWLDIPNMYQRAQQYWMYLADRYLLGTHSAKPPVDESGERVWFLVYAPVSFLYRLVVSYAVVILVMDLWFGLGVLIFVITLYMLFLGPLWKGLVHLAGQRVQAHRLRAWGGAGLAVALLGVLIFVVPFPHSLTAPGVLQASRQSVLYAPMDARLERAELGNGQRVRQAESLIWFDGAAITLEIAQAQAELDELLAFQRMAVAQRLADMRALQEQTDAKRQRLQDLNDRLSRLTVRAPHDGLYVALDGRERVGSWIANGTMLGHVLDPSAGFQFVAVISQERARELFRAKPDQAVLRLKGQADRDIELRQVVVVPYQRERLPSAALGWMGGGDLPIKAGDERGDKAAEEFFEIRASLVDTAAADALALHHGLRGVVRMEMPGRTLYQRVSESLRQLLQKRYWFA
jgi:putative peptide zinc metalloprotease protein